MDCNFYSTEGKSIRRTASRAAVTITVHLLTAACLFCLPSCTRDVNNGNNSGFDDTPAILQDIKISGVESNSKIKIIVSKPLKYKLYSIAEPPREVVDLYPAILNPFRSPLAVNSSLVSQIDITKHDNNGRPFTRIIFKLKRSVVFSASTDPSNNKDILLSVAELLESTQAGIEKRKDGQTPKAGLPRTNQPTHGSASATNRGGRNAQKSGQGETENVVYGINVNRNGIEIALNGSSDNLKAFKLTGPQRLVIDVFGARNSISRKIIPVNRFGVKNIRIGTYPDKVRIVFDSSKKIFPACRINADDQSIQVVFKK
jgi:type IV pilus assembly protein PilQ